MASWHCPNITQEANVGNQQERTLQLEEELKRWKERYTEQAEKVGFFDLIDLMHIYLAMAV